jgi:hypothetical protein
MSTQVAAHVTARGGKPRSESRSLSSPMRIGPPASSSPMAAATRSMSVSPMAADWTFAYHSRLMRRMPAIIGQ